jgi:hypothetical protein
MTRLRCGVFSVSAFALIACLTATAPAAIMETWESQSATDPFTGTGDVTWTGDLPAWAITTATWPTSPAQDFAGVRSLRSTNHGSVTGGANAIETVVTDITTAVDFSSPLEWSVFFSGNSASIQPSRRADFILLSDVSSVGTIEDPSSLNGYKVTLWDPYFNATDNVPPSSHEGAALADSLTLWRTTDTDDRWRVVGSIPLGTTDDLRDGWNIRARLDTDGTWSIGFANGAIGQTPALTSLGIDAGAPALSAFSGSVFAGVGWTAPNNSTNDYHDFGFDNFRVGAVPEPATAWLLAFAGLGVVNLRGRRRGSFV